MLLFEDAKKLEKALGPEAAEVLVKIFEAQDDAVRKDLATKADLREMELRLKNELLENMAAFKTDTIKWVAGMLLAQAAIIAALVKLLAK
jgi:hypothetical protein